MVGHVIRTLRRSLSKYGFLGTLYRSWDYVYWKGWHLTPAGRQHLRKSKLADQSFDQQMGVDTGGIVRLAHYDVPDSTWIHGNYYEPVRPDRFHNLMTAAAILDPENFLFIDMGAGKGRAVFLASEIPFRKIIGIEFVPDLVEQARENLARFQNPRQQCRDLEMVQMDATKYPLPNEPTVLYLYNPFQVPLMEQVAQNVSRSLREAPRAFLVLYLNPMHDFLWQQIPELEKVAGNEHFTIYRAKPLPANS